MAQVTLRFHYWPALTLHCLTCWRHPLQVTQQNVTSNKDQACYGQVDAKEPVRLKASPVSEANPTDLSGASACLNNPRLHRLTNC